MPVANESQATSTGALEMPAEPDTSAQSITEGILAELGGEPLIPEKRKPGRPKKTQSALEAAFDDDESDPPADLTPPAEEADDEPEDTEATEGDEEKSEPTELEDQLAALAETSGVDPQLLAGSESIGEAQRFLDRMMSVLYRQGAAQAAPNGHAEYQQPLPAAPNGAVQKPAADALELDLSKYDDDEPIKSDLQKLLERDKRREAELAAMRADKDRARDEEFRRVQQDVAYQFQNEFFSAAPELFGSEKKQDPRQAQRMRRAFEVADTLIRGYATQNKPLPPVKAIARWAVNAEFAPELTKQELLNKRGKVQDRVNRRSVGAPASIGRSTSNPPSAEVHQGTMETDPDILAAVKGVLTRSRA